MKRLLAILFTATFATAAAAEPECRLVGKYENETVPVYLTSDGLVTFTADVDVNTDGALRSYKIDDLGVRRDGRMHTTSALNTICNGVNIRRPDNTVLYSSRQCSKLIAEFKRIRDFGWLRDGENYVDFYAISLVPGTETPKPARNRGKPCEKDGYYVSQVAKAIDPGKSVCDPERWVDALRIPAIVLPLDERMKNAGVALHDLSIVRLPNAKTWVGAIVGDTNPNKIGEATVIANMRLKGVTKVPKNYRASVKLTIPVAQYVVFPGTRTLIPNLGNNSDPVIQDKVRGLVEQYRLAERQQLCADTPPGPAPSDPAVESSR